MSAVPDLHEAVRRDDLAAMRMLLAADRALANARSETDARGTYPLHVAAEFGRADAASVLLEFGADMSLLDLENDSIALLGGVRRPPRGRSGPARCRSDANQRNKHGLTPLGCAVGGTRGGQWQRFSNATLDDWKSTADLIRSWGGTE